MYGDWFTCMHDFLSLISGITTIGFDTFCFIDGMKTVSLFIPEIAVINLWLIKIFSGTTEI